MNRTRLLTTVFLLLICNGSLVANTPWETPTYHETRASWQTYSKGQVLKLTDHQKKLIRNALEAKEEFEVHHKLFRKRNIDFNNNQKTDPYELTFRLLWEEIRSYENIGTMFDRLQSRSWSRARGLLTRLLPFLNGQTLDYPKEMSGLSVALIELSRTLRDRVNTDRIPLTAIHRQWDDNQDGVVAGRERFRMTAFYRTRPIQRFYLGFFRYSSILIDREEQITRSPGSLYIDHRTVKPHLDAVDGLMVAIRRRKLMDWAKRLRKLLRTADRNNNDRIDRNERRILKQAVDPIVFSSERLARLGVNRPEQLTERERTIMKKADEQKSETATKSLASNVATPADSSSNGSSGTNGGGKAGSNGKKGSTSGTASSDTASASGNATPSTPGSAEGPTSSDGPAGNGNVAGQNQNPSESPSSGNGSVNSGGSSGPSAGTTGSGSLAAGGEDKNTARSPGNPGAGGQNPNGNPDPGNGRNPAAGNNLQPGGNRGGNAGSAKPGTGNTAGDRTINNSGSSDGSNPSQGDLNRSGNNQLDFDPQEVSTDHITNPHLKRWIEFLKKKAEYAKLTPEERETLRQIYYQNSGSSTSTGGTSGNAGQSSGGNQAVGNAPSGSRGYSGKSGNPNNGSGNDNPSTGTSQPSGGQSSPNDNSGSTDDAPGSEDDSPGMSRDTNCFLCIDWNGDGSPGTGFGITEDKICAFVCFDKP